MKLENELTAPIQPIKSIKISNVGTNSFKNLKKTDQIGLFCIANFSI